MIDTLFDHPMLGNDATYRPGGAGSGVPVRVAFARPDVEIGGLGDTRLRATSIRLELRTAEVPSPSPGDTVTVGTTVYTLRGQAQADRERLVWTIEASAA